MGKMFPFPQKRAPDTFPAWNLDAAFQVKLLNPGKWDREEFTCQIALINSTDRVVMITETRSFWRMRGFNEPNYPWRVLDVDSTVPDGEVQKLALQWRPCGATRTEPSNAVHSIPAHASIELEVIATVPLPNTSNFDVNIIGHEWWRVGCLTRAGPVLLDFEFESIGGTKAGITVESVSSKEREKIRGHVASWHIDDAEAWTTDFVTISDRGKGQHDISVANNSVRIDDHSRRHAVWKSEQPGADRTAHTLRLFRRGEEVCGSVQTLIDPGRRAVYAYRIDYSTPTGSIRCFWEVPPYGDMLSDNAQSLDISNAKHAAPLENGEEYTPDGWTVEQSRCDFEPRVPLTEQVT